MVFRWFRIIEVALSRSELLSDLINNFNGFPVGGPFCNSTNSTFIPAYFAERFLISSNIALAGLRWAQSLNSS